MLIYIKIITLTTHEDHYPMHFSHPKHVQWMVVHYNNTYRNNNNGDSGLQLYQETNSN